MCDAHATPWAMIGPTAADRRSSSVAFGTMCVEARCGLGLLVSAAVAPFGLPLRAYHDADDGLFILVCGAVECARTSSACICCDGADSRIAAAVPQEVSVSTTWALHACARTCNLPPSRIGVWRYRARSDLLRFGRWTEAHPCVCYQLCVDHIRVEAPAGRTD